VSTFLLVKDAKITMTTYTIKLRLDYKFVNLSLHLQRFNRLHDLVALFFLSSTPYLYEAVMHEFAGTCMVLGLARLTGVALAR